MPELSDRVKNYEGSPIRRIATMLEKAGFDKEMISFGGGAPSLAPPKEIFDYLNEKLKRIRFFGHDDNKAIVEDGFNGKMTEIHAALGVANLNHFTEVIWVSRPGPKPDINEFAFVARVATKSALLTIRNNLNDKANDPDGNSD